MKTIGLLSDVLSREFPHLFTKMVPLNNGLHDQLIEKIKHTPEFSGVSTPEIRRHVVKYLHLWLKMPGYKLSVLQSFLSGNKRTAVLEEDNEDILKGEVRELISTLTEEDLSYFQENSASQSILERPKEKVGMA